MANWTKAVEDIQWHLKNAPNRDSFHTMEMAARDAVRKAAANGDEIELRTAMGQMSGLRRRWARVLIMRITECVFEKADTSRGKIRDWQQRILGQSLSSGMLNAYAEESRSGGGRSNFFEPDPATNAEARKIFKKYKDALKRLG